MRVLLPAPFSPRRAWISPGSTTRSMASFAVSVPKRFVMPRSSSFTWWPFAPREPPTRCGSTAPGCRSGALGLARRLDRDLAADDVVLHLFQLRLEVGGNLGVELVERGEAGAVVLEVTD